MNIKIDLYLIISIVILTMFKQVEAFLYFYFFVILHELAHVLVAWLLKIRVLEVSFLPFGVNAKFDFEDNIIKEIIIAIAGPIFSLCMSIAFKDFQIQNLFICITNLLPIYPLDGGRILKNFMRLIVGDIKGVKYYDKFLVFLVILLLIINIVLIVFLKIYQFAFVSFYIFQLAGEEIKKDKIRNRVMSILNMGN